MNSKSVLSRIVKVLTLSDDTPIQAKTKDGLILQSSNFDVDDDVMEVGEDGKTTPLADGEYTISFTTPEGKDNTQVIDIDGGKIASISAVKEAAQVAEGTDEEEGEEKMDDDAATSVAMAEAKVTDSVKEAEKGKAKALPNTTDEDEVNVHKDGDTEEQDGVIRMEDLAERLGSLEKAHKDLMEKLSSVYGMDALNNRITPDYGVEPLTPTNMSAEDEDELPKLDGAPIETPTRFSALENSKNFGKKDTGNYHASVLSKMYK